MDNTRIAVLGIGNVGGALSRLWAAKGRAVTYGVRDPQKHRADTASGTKISTNAEAVSGADIVALCVPWDAAEHAVRSSGDLSGKVLIDCTNPLAADLKSLVLGNTTSGAEAIAGWAPKAKVVKAFNTIGAPDYGNAQFGSLKADGFYCGDDQASKDAVKPLIEEAGLDPVDVGPLRNARLLEPLALLWIDLAVNQQQGVNHAFKLLRR